jgi:MFS family permease
MKYVFSASFIKLLAYRVQLVLAYQIITVVAGWHIYEITHDTLALGLLGLAEVVPYFASALFAGYAVDHYCSRRFFAITSGLILTLTGVTLTALSLGWLPGNPAGWIYGALVLTGLGRAFIAPSYSTLFAMILPREDYARGAGISSSVFQTGLIIGPALGGLIVGFADKSVAYAVATTLFAGGSLAMMLLRVNEPKAPESESVFAGIKEGLRFVKNNQVLFSAQMLDMFAVLFGGTVSMLPAFIHEIYHMGPQTLGLLRAAPAMGAILTSAYLAKHPINLHAGKILLLAVAGFGVCIIGFALSVSVYIAGLFLLLSGVCDGISVVLRTTIMQLATPDTMRGRVAAINGVFIGSSNELGAFESGVTARLMGLVPSVIFGGVMTLTVVTMTAKLAPKLRGLALAKLH